ncbi:MAG: DegT/DnrJ/EryC1/StrS family aminotransferase [Candidatus Geothermincolia bacterium]
MRDEFLVFGSPLIERPEIDEVVASMESGWLGTGPKVARFEQLFSEYTGSPFAIAVNSCTAALHLSMLAAGIGQGDEVIVPTMTFAATANAVIHAGGTPVFVDCDRDTMNIDPAAVEAAITERTRAVIPVHFAGRPCEMDALADVVARHGLMVIEDCAHAIETEYHAKKAGTFGDFGCFSFYVTKNIVTGEGGMVTTASEEHADLIKVLALHGLSKDAWSRFSDSGFKHYQVIYCGYKYNMMDIQAAMGLHQLPRVEEYWRRRRDLWRRYDSAFEGLRVFTPPAPEPDTRHAFHLYTLMLDIDNLDITRDQFMAGMAEKNIGTGVHYIALHLHPYYQETFGCAKGDFPNAEWISERTVSLPLSAKLSDGDAGDVIEAVTEILEG